MLPESASHDPDDLLAQLERCRRRGEWDTAAAFAQLLPEHLEGPWLAVADEIAFAKGHLRRTDEAVALYQRTFEAEPTHRRASALAYLHYDALWAARRSRRKKRGNGKDHGKAAKIRDREQDRAGFRRWLREALRLRPDSIVDLYRLGIFESQLENRHDAVALRALHKAITIYLNLPAFQKSPQHRLHKVYVRCLYAAARSAFRLRRYRDARRYVFECIRQDRDKNHVAALFKLHLAGRCCAALDQPEHAERAYRLALDAAEPKQNHDFVFLALAKLCLDTERPDEARRWIARHVRPHRRSPAHWRVMGDACHATGDVDAAQNAYQTALKRDKMGRHKTLERLGRIAMTRGDLRAAERHLKKAVEFRRRRYLSQDKALLDLIDEVRARRRRRQHTPRPLRETQARAHSPSDTPSGASESSDTPAGHGESEAEIANV